MNTVSAWIATLSFAVVAGPALADEVSFVNNEIGYQMVGAPSKVSRAQVIADLEQARRDGEIAASHEFVQPLDLAPSARTRDQVQRDAANASERERVARNALYGPDA